MESPGIKPGRFRTEQKGESNMILFMRIVMQFITVEVKISSSKETLI